MFRFHKTLDIVTLFHKASSPASVRVANLLKQASAASTSGGASESTREQFELNITEDQPTPDQVQTVLEYVGKSGIPKIITGAHDEKDALKKYIQNKDSLVRPLVVDWNNGKAISGDNESEILKLLNAKK